MENVSVIKPNLSTTAGGLPGVPGASAEACPTMADTVPGKLFRDPENSSEERERSRKKVKARTDTVRATWAKTTDDLSTAVTFDFGGEANGDATVSSVVELTSPAASDGEDDPMAGEKTAKPPTSESG